MNKLLSFTALVTALMGALPASGTVIDFNSIGLPSPSVNQGTSFTVTADGVDVTFSSTANMFIEDIAGQRVLRADTFQEPITVTFGGGFTAAFVEIDDTDFYSGIPDVDVVTGEAFDASNVSLGTNTVTFQTGSAIHHLNGPGIAKVVYDDVNTGYVIDNFVFSAVPEPASLVLACLGMLSLAGYNLRRRMSTGC